MCSYYIIVMQQLCQCICNIVNLFHDLCNVAWVNNHMHICQLNMNFVIPAMLMY